AREVAAEEIVKGNYGDVVFNDADVPLQRALDPKDRLSRVKARTREEENAQLVRAAIEEQSHRIDALMTIIQGEEGQAMKKAHRDLLAAIERLPPDEQKVLRL